MDNYCDAVRDYYCGDSARGCLEDYLERMETNYGSHVTATFQIKGRTEPLSEDGRWRVDRWEKWYYEGEKRDGEDKLYHYIYFLVESPSNNFGFCIDEYLHFTEDAEGTDTQ